MGDRMGAATPPARSADGDGKADALKTPGKGGYWMKKL
jgi:hypothetical protein